MMLKELLSVFHEGTRLREHGVSGGVGRVETTAAREWQAGVRREAKLGRRSSASRKSRGRARAPAVGIGGNRAGRHSCFGLATIGRGHHQRTLLLRTGSRYIASATTAVMCDAMEMPKRGGGG